MAIRILLADDDPALRKVLGYKLKQEGYDVTAVADGEEAVGELSNGQYDLLLTDMKMPRLTGIELLERAKMMQSDIEVILMTAFAEISDAVKAVKLGAFDYLTKPFDDDQLFVAIDKALKFKRLEDENKALKKRLADSQSFEQPIGVSKPFKELLSLVDRVASSDATVLINGESGSGKELIARLIHNKSGRSGDFIAVNCAAIPKELLESELFGHVKGAFTGAVRDKKGKFLLADNGTLLLDEIAEMPFELQAKLLRVIQERHIEPVGSEKQVDVDVRLLAATNVDLKKRVSDSKFREDLFYRLHVIPVVIPPLCERAEDIPLLTNAFLKKYSPSQQIQIYPDLMQRLTTHRWPGNVRELENLIERMVVLRRSDKLTVDDLPAEYRNDDDRSKSAHEVINNQALTFQEAEKSLIIDALKTNNWNRSKAAAQLNIPRHVLLYRIKKYNIEVE